MCLKQWITAVPARALSKCTESDTAMDFICNRPKVKPVQAAPKLTRSVIIGRPGLLLVWSRVISSMITMTECGAALALRNPTLWCWIPQTPISKSFGSSAPNCKPTKTKQFFKALHPPIPSNIFYTLRWRLNPSTHRKYATVIISTTHFSNKNYIQYGLRW